MLDEYQAALERIEVQPAGCGPLETFAGSREIRRLLLRRFPYMVIYEVFPDEVMVLAVAHVSRRPHYWIER